MSNYLQSLEANQRGRNPIIELQRVQRRLAELQRRTITRGEATERYADKDYVNQQDARMTVSQILRLQDLRALWPMSSVDASDNVRDLSGQARTLTNNNSVTFATTDRHTVYAEFDGVNQSFSRTDEAGLDLTSDFTAAVWLWLDTWTSGDVIMGKDDASSQRSWRLSLTGTYGSTNAIRAEVSSNGTSYAVTLDTVQDKVLTGRWYHVVVRYTASTELAIFVNTARYATTTSIPASLHDSSAAFGLGFTTGGTGSLDGRIKHCWLAAAVIETAELFRLFDQQKGLFDVV